MKNTSILIPIILIVCLGALIYLFIAAMNAADNPSGQGGNDRIILNPADYSDDPLPEDLGECRKLAEEIGYPVIIKASGGGGGRGMNAVLRESPATPFSARSARTKTTHCARLQPCPSGEPTSC